ncbi:MULTISPECIES: single-stranded DNA-binding protein [Campylobacter]|jgi:single-stranded DNA-binding protein|uniref:Single-stranded DNA-binding protein n=1 Tax=Campylobacter showae CSUNSWCD TaxID=1244083 RepID=M5IDY8_9BACT|nr:MULTISPECIES: single-stranded DNA-binding protein [Campylobacter]EKU10582.1 Single-stranded DNA-binding protein [Campylobacter showae CSUNSWCD]RKV96087.1 MAG: single-stranded DNA-binding protein [Campylobacter sp.]
MFAQATIIGNLTKDIELRYTASGMAIGNTAIASTHKFNAANGEKREETCFIDVTFMGKSAEIANQYLAKGSRIFIEGRLKFDRWTDNNGQNRSKHSVVVDKMIMLDTKDRQEIGQNEQTHSASQIDNEYIDNAQDAPFEQ